VKIAIIGAGMAGLSCGDALVRAGHEATLFDKGRGVGGRMSTRRTETVAGQAFFDHGAQYFTARDPGFLAVVGDWESRNVAARWPDAGHDAWVGVPGMNAVIRDMAARHDVELGFLAKGLVKDDGRWHVAGESGARGPFDAVVVATPAEQAASILALHDFDMARAALQARSQPCWTAMYAFARPIALHADFLKDVGAIAWAARNNAKPGREALECWVVQANPTWSSEHLEESADAIAQALQGLLEKAVGAPLPEIVYSAAHRWRFAMSSGSGHGALWNPYIRLGVCGDWLVGARVECAWLSGQDLARKLAGVKSSAPETG
jgi:renalase